MKYLQAFTAVAAVLTAAVFTLLGVQWVYQGVGMHPALAGLGVALCTACCWQLAGVIDEAELSTEIYSINPENWMR